MENAPISMLKFSEVRLEGGGGELEGGKGQPFYIDKDARLVEW